MWPMRNSAFRTLYKSCDGIIIEFDSDREEPHREIIDKINEKRLPVVSIVVQSLRLHTSLHVSVDAESIGRIAADMLSIGLRRSASRKVVIFGGKKGVDVTSKKHSRVSGGMRQISARIRGDCLHQRRRGKHPSLGFADLAKASGYRSVFLYPMI